MKRARKYVPAPETEGEIHLRRKRQKDCQECGAKTSELFDDARSPPIDDVPCLCKDCYIWSIEDEISDKEIEIKDLREALAKANRI